jgi:hypothetical protein
VVSLAETLSLSVMFENLPVLDGCFCHSDNVSLCTESLNQYSSSFSSINDLKKKNVKIYYFSKKLFSHTKFNIEAIIL